MRNQFFNLAMLVALLFTSSVTSMMAQNPSEWTKISTNTIKGLKCDHYLEGYRTFRLDNGDFFSFKESEYGVDRTNYSGDQTVGDLRITEKTGSIVETKGNTITRTYNTGYILSGEIPASYLEKDLYTGVTEWEYVEGVITEGPYKREMLHLNDKWFTTLTSPEGKIYKFIRRDEFLREYKTSFYMDSDMADYIYFFLDDSKTHLYCITRFGVFLECAKIVNNIICYCRPDEEISSAEEVGHKTYKVTYNNGDTLRIENGYLSGVLNRKEGKLTLKLNNGKPMVILEYPDGSKIAGNNDTFQKRTPTCLPQGDLYLTPNVFSYQALALPELSIYNGYLIKPDGTSTRYIEGRTEAEIQAEKEFLQKAAVAKVSAERQALEKKYGKQFVDGLCLFPRPKIYVGCPLALLNEVYYVIEELSNQSVTQYEVGTKSDKKSWITGARFRVWVNNATKKVTAVQTL